MVCYGGIPFFFFSDSDISLPLHFEKTAVKLLTSVTALTLILIDTLFLRSDLGSMYF